MNTTFFWLILELSKINSFANFDINQNFIYKNLKKNPGSFISLQITKLLFNKE